MLKVKTISKSTMFTNFIIEANNATLLTHKVAKGSRYFIITIKFLILKFMGQNK
jgi:hypothetical protein